VGGEEFFGDIDKDETHQSTKGRSIHTRNRGGIMGIIEEASFVEERVTRHYHHSGRNA
jgi:hypothetical protein